MRELASLFTQLEGQYGLPAGYLARTAQIESNNNPNAKNPRSSAGGLFQFIDSTAQQMGLRNKFDPVESAHAAARLGAQNMAYLRRQLGRDVDGGELYLAHQQGAGGATKLLTNPDADAMASLGVDHVRLNGGRPGMRNAEMAQLWLSKFGGQQPQSQYAAPSRLAYATGAQATPQGQPGGFPLVPPPGAPPAPPQDMEDTGYEVPAYGAGRQGYPAQQNLQGGELFADAYRATKEMGQVRAGRPQPVQPELGYIPTLEELFTT